MRRRISVPLLVLSFSVLVCATSLSDKELTGLDLLAEQEWLSAINCALHQGHTPVNARDYPQALGLFNSTPVQEIFVCPQRMPDTCLVKIVYAHVDEIDCSSMGDPLYAFFGDLGMPRYYACSPLVNRVGRLVDDGFSWSIFYRRNPPNESVVNEPLFLDQSTACERRTQSVSCSDLHQDQTIEIEATRSGYYLVPVKIRILTSQS